MNISQTIIMMIVVRLERWFCSYENCLVLQGVWILTTHTEAHNSFRGSNALSELLGAHKWYTDINAVKTPRHIILH